MPYTKSPLINNWTDDISRRESNTGLTSDAVGRIFSGFNITLQNNHSYVRSTDTSVLKKSYYTRSGTDPNFVYTLVEEPTGNPSTNMYYERTVDLNDVLEPGVFRFEFLSEIKNGGSGSYPSITKPTGGLSGFIQIMDNRASNAADGNAVTHIHQIIYPDASIVTATTDVEPDGTKFSTVAGSAPYERIGVKASTSVSKFTWTEWKVLGGSGGLQPVVLSAKTDRPIATKVNAKENVLYIAFGDYNIVLPAASSVSTGTKIGVEQHTGTSTITESGTDHQVVAAPESTYSISYTKTTDTSVVLSKSYYTISGSSPNYVYTLVNNPTGNPNTNNYYERSIVGGNVIADASIRYTFECVLSNDGITHTWVLDVDGNHGAAIELINNRIFEANNRISRVEEVLIPAKGRKLRVMSDNHSEPKASGDDSTILTNLTTTGDTDIRNECNFRLYDQEYNFNVGTDKTIILPALTDEFKGGKIVINVYTTTAVKCKLTLKQTIGTTEYSTEFDLLPKNITIFELEWSYNSELSITCWNLISSYF